MRNLLTIMLLLLPGSLLFAGENLRLNPKLDYETDSQNGPLITGEKMLDGLAKDKPNYIIIYEQGCFNSKRQARRTVNLYNKYRGRVHFVIIDLDLKGSNSQEELVKKYYAGYIPHIVVLDRVGKPVYNRSGEVEESWLAGILDDALK